MLNDGDWLFWWTQEYRAWSPRRHALPRPEPDIFDSPDVHICINQAWVSHLLGVLEVLAAADAWSGDDATKYGATQQIEALMDALANGACMNPIGSIQMFGGTTVPAKWLLCDGAPVSRTTYAELFTAVGTTYGAGDTTTTFNLPDFRGRAPIGAGTGTGLTARTLGEQVGSETHSLSLLETGTHSHTISASNSVGSTSNVVARGSSASGNVTTQPLAGSLPHNNMQPSLVAAFMIYAGV